MYKAVLFSFILILSSCLYSNLEEMNPLEELCVTDTVSVTYTKDIAPLLTENCGTTNTCHQTTGNLSDVPLATYEDVNSVVITGQLLSAVTHDGNAPFMPKGGNILEDCKLNKIRAWINQGVIE